MLLETLHFIKDYIKTDLTLKNTEDCFEHMFGNQLIQKNPMIKLEIIFY